MSSLSPERLNELEQIAKAATPGPWCWEFTGEKSNEWAIGVAVGPDDQPISGHLITTDDKAYANESGVFMDESVIRRTFIGEGDTVADAAFIATFNPETVLALLSEVRALRERVEALQSLRAALPERYFMGAPRMPGGAFATFERIVDAEWLEGVKAILEALSPSSTAKEPRP